MGSIRLLNPVENPILRSKEENFCSRNLEKNFQKWKIKDTVIMSRERRQRLGETMQKNSSPKVNTQLKYTQRKTVGGKDLTLFDVETESFLRRKRDRKSWSSYSSKELNFYLPIGVLS